MKLWQTLALAFGITTVVCCSRPSGPATAEATPPPPDPTWTVVCYSDGREIFSGRTTNWWTGDSGYVTIKDLKTGTKVSIRADCVITREQ